MVGLSGGVMDDCSASSSVAMMVCMMVLMSVETMDYAMVLHLVCKRAERLDESTAGPSVASTASMMGDRSVSSSAVHSVGSTAAELVGQMDDQMGAC